MVRTYEQLLKEGIQPILVDLTQIGVHVTAESWYLSLLTMIVDALSLDVDVVNRWRSRPHLSVADQLTRFFKEAVLARAHKPVVVFF